MKIVYFLSAMVTVLLVSEIMDESKFSSMASDGEQVRVYEASKAMCGLGFEPMQDGKSFTCLKIK